MVPVVTIAGLSFGYLLGGSVVIESVFNINGLGRLVVDSILSRDYPVIQVSILVLAVNVAMVRPWKERSITMIVGNEMPLLCPCNRASLMAASLASAPELQKKALSIPDKAIKRSASSSCFLIWYKLEV